MFKGKLVENQKYYKLRSINIAALIITSIIIGLLVNFAKLPLWLTVTLIAAYLLTLYISGRKIKAMVSMASKSIEIDTNEIRIKGNKGATLESINLQELDEIVVQNEYAIAGESITDVKDEALGNYRKHFLILKKAKESRQLYFEIDSHYMMKQLDKVITSWKKGSHTLAYAKEGLTQ